MALVFDGETSRSCLQIHDAQNFADEPLARLWLRNRVPLQFHGNWAGGVL